MKNFAVFVSGNGRGAREIIKDSERKLIHPKLALIVTSNDKSSIIEYGAKKGIPVAIVENNKTDKKTFELDLINVLDQHNIDYIFLAGWMLIIGKTLIDRFPCRIVNIHPSLLPSFSGKNAIDQAVDYGVKITGITTHLIDEKIDEGSIIGQLPVFIEDADSFEEIDRKIFSAGKSLTRETINKLFI